MALALYRKYRPATFAEVVGQEHVTDPLRIALAAKRVNHAYLFSGPRGCGKTSSARILARSLNCVQGPTPDPCGVCNSCVALAPNGTGNVDVIELDAASHGGVDDTRELRDKAFYAPAESRYRIFIIDEAHMVTTQGFNALLKIVEEPPEHLIFVFATTEPDKVLPTIRSRTHHYPFRLIPPGAMRALLERNCAAEGVTVAAPVFPLVIKAGGGSARDTQSVLDQLLAGAGPEGVTYDRAVALLGVTDVALIDQMVEGLIADDGPAVFGTVNSLVEAGHDPRRFAADLLDRLRDLVLLKAVPDAATKGLVAAPEDELATMISQADRMRAGTLTRYAETVHAGLTEMRGATAARLLLELVCSRMLLPSVADGESAMLQRLEALETRATLAPGALAAAPAAGQAPARGGAAEDAGRAPAFQRPSQRPAEPAAAAEPARRPEPAQPARQERPAEPEAAPAAQAPAPQAAPVQQPVQAAPAASVQSAPAAPAPTEPAQAAPAQEAPAQAVPQAVAPEVVQVPDADVPVSGALDAVAVRRVWPQLLAAVRAASRSTEAMLSNATVQEVAGNTVVVSHTSAPLARRLAEPRNSDAIAQALTSVLGGQWQVRCVHGEPGAVAAAPAAAKPARPAPTRPSQGAPREDGEQPPQRRMVPSRDTTPLPPEPPELDEPPPPEPEDEEELLAEAARPQEPGTDGKRLDPEEIALQLLADELGAKPLKS
ncbi:DNA polymerase III subunit gamma and tau [Solihabitans fulvus]|uniref:DNA polymerase III subunit gamma and tau n=1 Tax=Solihabitans fulvus TaxID=1892852 RepID=UPI001CB75F49|nr:DNA polymerase III subunit gamma and tau [Solihabitans fulvus]